MYARSGVGVAADLNIFQYVMYQSGDSSLDMVTTAEGLSLNAESRFVRGTAHTFTEWRVGMKAERLWALMCWMLMVSSASAATPFTLPGDDRVLPSSLELERRTQPWCPRDCAVLVPFVAHYQKGSERLVFVGVRHAFQAQKSHNAGGQGWVLCIATWSGNSGRVSDDYG